MKRTRQRVLVRAATLMGLLVPPDALDREVADREKKMVEEATKRTKRPVTLAEVLAEKGQTREELRREVGDGLLAYVYLLVVRQGIPGKRPQVDTEPSPADLRRVYAAHKDKFDVQPGARIAWWRVLAVDHLADGKRSYDEAVAEAKRVAEAIAAAARTGRPPEEVSKACGVDEEHAPVVLPEALSSEEFDVIVRRAENWRAEPGRLEAIEAWVYDPARRPGEAAVFETPNGGFAAIAILDVRAAERKSFEQVQKEVADRIRLVRQKRVETQHFLELLQRATIWPTRLAAEIETDARRFLKQLESDPFAKDVWLR
jgi:hypothetical protein